MDRFEGARCARLCALGLLLLGSGFAAPAMADVVTIAPVAAATGNDDAPKDDVYDDFSEGDFVVVLSLIGPSGLYEARGVYEFDLEGLTGPFQTTIETATLRLPQSSAWKLGAYFYAMQVYGYAGDGAIQLSDFEIETGQIGTIPIDVNADEYELDVTDFVQARFDAGEIAGFNLVSNQTDMQVILHDDAVQHAELEVTFAPPEIPALGSAARLPLAALLGLVGFVRLRGRHALW